MLITVYGVSRSGKNTIGDYLVREYGFQMWAFADPLRSVLLDVLKIACPATADFILAHGWEETKAECDWIVPAMIALGAGMRKYVHEDVWLTGFPKEVLEKGGNLFISDCRHLNELNLVKSLGGQAWRVTRNGTIPQGMDLLLADWKGWDQVFTNNGTIEALEEKVKKVVTRLLKEEEAR